MIPNFPPSLRRNPAAWGATLCLTLLLFASSAAAQLLKNGSFESPIDPPGSSGTNNWVLVYAYGGPADFARADRDTEANTSGDGGSFGAAFRPAHDSFAHAYHKQIVTNLVPGAAYVLSGYMHYGFDNSKYSVYIAMLGGPAGTTVVSNRATTTKTLYYMTNTASASGRIEVRVGLNKHDTYASSTADCKFCKSDGWFDRFTLNPVSP